MTSHERYRRNLDLIPPFVYAQVKGIAFDSERLEAIRAECTAGLWEAQARVDAAAGLETPATPDAVLAACAASHLCAKVAMRRALTGYVDKQPLVVDGVPVLTPKGNPKMTKVAVPARKLSWTLCLENANSDCRQAILRLKELCEEAENNQQTPTTMRKDKSKKEATELEYLTWFRLNTDFGPADSDVKHIMHQQFEKETGKLVPKDWRWT